MKVLMLGWEFPPFISGGLGTACFGITKGLFQNGIETIFVVPRMKGRRKTSHVHLVDGSGIHIGGDSADKGKKLRVKPVDFFLIPYMSEESYKKALEEATEDIGKNLGNAKSLSWEHYGPDMYSEVFRYEQVARVIARQEDFDIIHVHDWMTIPAGMEVKNVTGRPLIIHIHSLESDRSAMRLNERIFGIERLGMMEADHVIAVSHYTKKKIVDQYGVPHDKISVVHNAVSRSESCQRCQVKKNPSRKYVLFLGRITSQKGPDYFLEAAWKILLKNSDIHFIMAGSGDMMQHVKEMVVQLGIENNVYFTGFLGDIDVEKAYAMSDLYVMPSVSEPFGITALEAIMYDVPVIISKQSGVSEVIRNCPRVDFWNTDELAERVVEILENDTLRDEIVRHCREELKDVNWKIAAEKIINVYQRLML
jgi:glycogen(starch) synthase